MTRRQPPQSPTELLLAALLDPHDPRFCGVCLVGCMTKVFPDRSRAKLHVSMSEQHEAWRTLMNFLTRQTFH